jgi:hypothetical protein
MAQGNGSGKGYSHQTLMSRTRVPHGSMVKVRQQAHFCAVRPFYRVLDHWAQVNWFANFDVAKLDIDTQWISSAIGKPFIHVPLPT